MQLVQQDIVADPTDAQTLNNAVPPAIIVVDKEETETTFDSLVHTFKFVFLAFLLDFHVGQKALSEARPYSTGIRTFIVK